MSTEVAHSSEAATEQDSLRRHDLIVAILVWVIALAAFIESWRLTFHLELPGIDAEKAWLVAPGIFPLVLSAGLLGMASVVAGIALKEGRFVGFFSTNRVLSYLAAPENRTQITQITLLCLYVFGLLGTTHFGIASAIYLFASMFAARAGSWYVLLAIATAFSAAVTLLFGTVMKIPLP